MCPVNITHEILKIIQGYFNCRVDGCLCILKRVKCCIIYTVLQACVHRFCLTHVLIKREQNVTKEPPHQQRTFFIEVLIS